MAQLKSTNITGNLSVTGSLLVSGVMIPSAPANSVIMADGTTKDAGEFGSNVDLSNYLTKTVADGVYQAKDDDLTKIAALTGGGLLKRKTDNTWTLDTTAYTTNAGTVTEITLGNGLTGGPITTSGTISLDKDLEAIAALGGTSGFLKKTAANTWTLDVNTYAQAPAGNLNGSFLITGPDKTKAGASGGDSLYYYTNTYVTSTGQINAPEFKIAEKATMKYDSARQIVKFVFS